MYYAYKYRLEPSDAHHEELDRYRDICRQLYNHTRYRLNEYRENHGELPSMTTLRSELPDLKQWWDGLSDVYSKVLQTAVERLFNNLSSLSALKQNGYGIGQLKWKPPGPTLRERAKRASRMGYFTVTFGDMDGIDRGRGSLPASSSSSEPSRRRPRRSVRRKRPRQL